MLAVDQERPLETVLKVSVVNCLDHVDKNKGDLNKNCVYSIGVPKDEESFGTEKYMPRIVGSDAHLHSFLAILSDL